LCHFPDSTSPFQVFHVELNFPFSFQRVFDPICRAAPQGNYLFISNLPRNPSLWITNPKPVGYYPFHARYRTLRINPAQLNQFQRPIVESLRILEWEDNAELIAQKHQRAFDELVRLRRRATVETDELDLFRLFLADLQAYPVLKSDEQLLLARIWRAGGPEAPLARERLVVHNLRLVISVARKYQGRGLEFLDLIQEGTPGLLRAIDTFDPDHGTQFSTYAIH